MIRLGRWQRRLVQRCLDSRLGLVFPLGKREIEARNALLRRGLLVPSLGNPGAYALVANEHVRIHLQGTLTQHRKE
jgi:hypothetical protein